jgi:uncharacterized membrane protein YqhA
MPMKLYLRRSGALLGLMVAEIVILILSIQLIKHFLTWNNEFGPFAKLVVNMVFWGIYISFMYYSFKYMTAWLKK